MITRITRGLGMVLAPQLVRESQFFCLAPIALMVGIIAWLRNFFFCEICEGMSFLLQLKHDFFLLQKVGIQTLQLKDEFALRLPCWWAIRVNIHDVVSSLLRCWQRYIGLWAWGPWRTPAWSHDEKCMSMLLKRWGFVGGESFLRKLFSIISYHLTREFWWNFETLHRDTRMIQNEIPFWSFCEVCTSLSRMLLVADNVV